MLSVTLIKYDFTTWRSVAVKTINKSKSSVIVDVQIKSQNTPPDLYFILRLSFEVRVLQILVLVGNLCLLLVTGSVIINHSLQC